MISESGNTFYTPNSNIYTSAHHQNDHSKAGCYILCPLKRKTVKHVTSSSNPKTPSSRCFRPRYTSSGLLGCGGATGGLEGMKWN